MPSSPPATAAFDATHARNYDRQLEPIRGFKDALHLLVQGAFSRLPETARILVAGAGTAAEARYLAPLHAGWRFTLVDPSAAMLDAAREHAEAEGFVDRCTFHVGWVSDLPVQAHDAATSLLVSHFLVDEQRRVAFFRDIADRLKPGGLLFCADLAADREHPSFATVMDLWLTLYVAPERQDSYRAMFGHGVAAHAPAQVEEMMVQAGFAPPAACYQAALICGWVARKAAGSGLATCASPLAPSSPRPLPATPRPRPRS